MKTEDVSWATQQIDAFCAKHSYDLDSIQRKFNLVDSDAGVPLIRKMLAGLLADHHYDLVQFFAEFLQKDRRSTYQALGRTFERKCAKAPTTSPQLLRLRDRAAEGKSCFVAKYHVLSPWEKNAKPIPHCVRIFAVSKAEATSQAELQGSYVIPGGKVLNLRVIDILDDPDAEKADVTRIQFQVGYPDTVETAEATSFAQADALLAQLASRYRKSYTEISLSTRIEWEHGANYTFTDSLISISRTRDFKLADSIRDQIAFVLDGYKHPHMTERENREMLARFLEQGAKAHVTDIRETCRLGDPVAVA